MYYITLKFLSREPKKTLNFIRDIAIPIILLLTVGAIIGSVNVQLTNLTALTAQSDVLIIRDTNKPIEQSIIPSNLTNQIHESNIKTITPFIYQNESVQIQNNNKTMQSFIQFVATNLTALEKINPFTSFSSNQLNKLTGSEVLIGSQLAKDYQITSNNLNNFSIYVPSTKSTFTIGLILEQSDNYVNSLVIDFTTLKLINESYDNSYYSQIMMNVKDSSKITSTLNSIQQTINEFYPNSNLKVIQGSGTSFLLSSILEKIIEQINIFNFILDIIIIVRILQVLLWISHDYEFELNELKIMGSSTFQIYLLFILISIIIGNLGILLGILGTIFIPPIITYLISIFTLQSATVHQPSLYQMLVTVVEMNILIIGVSFIPAFILSSKHTVSQKSREAMS